MGSALLSAFGQSAGGLLGGALGSVLGSVVDAAIGGRGRGTELRLTSSSYGATLVRVFGRMRVGGHLVWAHQLQPGGGKGGSSSGAIASLAFLVSARPAVAVGRIWADGREWRNAAGRFTTPVTMRFHPGRGHQPADPAIVAVEGEDAPAYRGRALVVFEALPLAPFGNRIPQLSFEVDSGEAKPTSWAQALAGDGVAVEPEACPPGTPQPSGFAASFEAPGSELTGLAAWSGLAAGRRRGQLALGRPRRVTVDPARAAAPSRRGRIAYSTDRSRAPERVILGYFDRERDYLAGTMAEGRAGRAHEERLDAEVAASAETARAIAARRLGEARAGADTLELPLAFEGRAVEPGDHLVLEGHPHGWRVTERRIEGFHVLLNAQRLPEGGRPALPADPGRPPPAGHRIVPPSRIEGVELPFAPWAGEGPTLFVAAGGGPGWQGATLSAAGPGAPFVEIARLERPQPMGTLAEPLPRGPAHLWQEDVELVVAFDDPDYLPESLGARAVLDGAHALLVGDEVVQFRSARPVKDGRVALSGLLRGRYATEHAIAEHQPGERVVFLQPDRLARLALGADRQGAPITLLAEGPGDPPGGTISSVTILGRAMAPLAPAQLKARRRADGGLALSWIARHRRALSGDEGPAPAPGGGWSVSIGPAGAPPFQLMAHAPAAEVPAAVAAGWSGPLVMEVEAVGDGPRAQRLSRASLRLSPV